MVHGSNPQLIILQLVCLGNSNVVECTVFQRILLVTSCSVVRSGAHWLFYNQMQFTRVDYQNITEQTDSMYNGVG